jgi:segregation and condensation protein A
VQHTPDFEEQAEGEGKSDSQFVLDLDGYGGPIDALLQLCREQKVDVTKISILALADQYLDFIARARRLRLELAADYLVMAAWLAYLKSRLLLPEPSGDEEPSGAEMAAALKFQLQRLQAMQDAGSRLMARPRLGAEIFSRGEAAPLRVVSHVTYEVSLYDLLKAYGQSRSHGEVASLRIDPSDLYSVDDAIHRLGGLIGGAAAWRSLTAFLPSELPGGLRWRSALASTLAAALEMSRRGALDVRQDGPFEPIYLRSGGTATTEGS